MFGLSRASGERGGAARVCSDLGEECGATTSPLGAHYGRVCVKTLLARTNHMQEFSMSPISEDGGTLGDCIHILENRLNRKVQHTQGSRKSSVLLSCGGNVPASCLL